MSNWRVDIHGVDLAPGVELQIEARSDEAMAAGDKLYFANSKNARDSGSVIQCDRSEAVIMKDTGRWRIQRASDDSVVWKVVGSVE
jgi:hypothetical protein